VRQTLAQPGSRVAGSAATRQALLNTATELFARRGFKATTLREIALAVGIKAPSVYNHFGSKGELLHAAVDDVIDEFYRQVVAPVNPADPALDQVLGVVRRYVLYTLSPSSRARVADLLLELDRTRHDLSIRVRRRVLDRQRRFYRFLREIVVESAAETSGRVSPAVLTFSIINISDTVGSWFDPRGSLSRDEVADQVCLLVTAMLQGRVAPALSRAQGERT
jgi:AcrR family transcriptional regulator